MSIKENIKEEIVKRIKHRQQILYLLQDASEKMNDDWHRGRLQEIDEELLFLDKLEKFVESI